MMKKSFGISLLFFAGVLFTACSDPHRNPGRVYMPDMAYSRALETYAKPDSTKFTNDLSELGEGKIYYTAMPVAGTMARGDEMPFPFAFDKTPDTTNYVASKQFQNPLPELTGVQMQEAERLYLVNCAICHGMKLDGEGPLYNGGKGPFPSAPKNLVADPAVLKMPDGQMFYSITYGKNNMGSYASQISSAQRWMIIHYIKAQQAKKTSAQPPTSLDSSGAKVVNKDSTKVN
ncbi:MAG TPA: cytochrome c [Chitinophagaceae bacterium]|nr:cytochrome c [Chitinophagaceae bacterium]